MEQICWNMWSRKFWFSLVGLQKRSFGLCMLMVFSKMVQEKTTTFLVTSSSERRKAFAFLFKTNRLLKSINLVTSVEWCYLNFQALELSVHDGRFPSEVFGVHRLKQKSFRLPEGWCRPSASHDVAHNKINWAENSTLESTVGNMKLQSKKRMLLANRPQRGKHIHTTHVPWKWRQNLVWQNICGNGVGPSFISKSKDRLS